MRAPLRLYALTSVPGSWIDTQANQIELNTRSVIDIENLFLPFFGPPFQHPLLLNDTRNSSDAFQKRDSHLHSGLYRIYFFRAPTKHIGTWSIRNHRTGNVGSCLHDLCYCTKCFGMVVITERNKWRPSTFPSGKSGGVDVRWWPVHLPSTYRGYSWCGWRERNLLLEWQVVVTTSPIIHLTQDVLINRRQLVLHLRFRTSFWH